MSATLAVVEKHIQIPAEQAKRLSYLAQQRKISEDQLVTKALDILFSLTDLLDSDLEQKGWSFLSEASLQRVWDNEQDAVYDNWRELYGIPEG